MLHAEAAYFEELNCCGSGMFISDPNFFHPGSRVKKIPIQIPDTNLDFFYPSRIPDPGVKKAPDPGSRIRIGNIVNIYKLGDI
jgi:hypothetical protein